MQLCEIKILIKVNKGYYLVKSFCIVFFLVYRCKIVSKWSTKVDLRNRRTQNSVSEKMRLPGKATSDWIGMEERADSITNAYSYELLVWINLIFISSSKCLCYSDALQQPNQSDYNESFSDIL